MDVKKIYEFIDKKGIPFKKMSSIGISINENYEITKDDYPKQFIKIELPFDLNSEQQNQIVLDYIFDLTTFRFTDVNELLSKKALNNMPFILELNEHSNPKLFVAFKRIPQLPLVFTSGYKTLFFYKSTASPPSAISGNLFLKLGAPPL